jgi:predicted DNA-binding protein
MSTLHRAQILLETEQHQALADLAEQEGRSVSDLVREIVRRHLDEQARNAQAAAALQAIDVLSTTRTRLREQRGLYQGDPVAEVRAEQNDDMERLWRDEP